MNPAPLMLPTRHGTLEPWTPSAAHNVTPSDRPAVSRVAYAAVHVVADPLSPADPGELVTLDWDATLAFRRHIWSCGLGVAEAMDTAQRGMGLDWPTTRELISRTGAEAAGRLWCAGVGTRPAATGSGVGRRRRGGLAGTARSRHRRRSGAGRDGQPGAGGRRFGIR